MDITHKSLIDLGFVELFNRPGRYVYKGVTGRLLPEGRFHFHGFSPMIEQLSDLKYMMMLINYNYQTTVEPYPSHLN